MAGQERGPASASWSALHGPERRWRATGRCGRGRRIGARRVLESADTRLQLEARRTIRHFRPSVPARWALVDGRQRPRPLTGVDRSRAGDVGQLDRDITQGLIVDASSTPRAISIVVRGSSAASSHARCFALAAPCGAIRPPPPGRCRRSQIGKAGVLFAEPACRAARDEDVRRDVGQPERSNT